MLPFPTSSFVRYNEPPAVGSPSSAYHCRSTPASGTPVLLHVNVLPRSSERAVLKLARLRSLKYRRPEPSTASSVSPPPTHGVTFPFSGAEDGTHLNVLPPSSDRQIQL